ncbi:MAG: hypothetical protein E5V30_17830 [Mesorhizobium sp.]|nr:MAG: hypothetical protein E5V30_17830 [Mesorhizobium sp.]
MIARAIRIATAAAVLAMATAGSVPAESIGPVYDGNGQLLLPKGYETWVFAGSNLGLAYNDSIAAMTALEAERAGSKLFHNVYIDPASYTAFAKTGEFPDPTVLVMENYSAEAKDVGGLLNDGVFNGSRIRTEVAVKDSHRPTRPDSLETWAYYVFPADGSGQPAQAASAFPDAVCHACHKLHAGHDNVWTQFYPLLRRRLDQ